MRSVIIVGAGPAGLTAARVLRDGGVRDIVVLERTLEAGGLPRAGGHLGWGLFDFHRVWTGPNYARKLVQSAVGVEIGTDVTVTSLDRNAEVTVSSSNGIERLSAKIVLLAMGIRETPRSARLVSGSRPSGVTTTGAFQDMVYVGAMRPFARPVIVGSELVSFSAILAARHAGIKPVAMLEERDRITARWPSDLAAKCLFGVKVMTKTKLVAIRGGDRVEAVEVECRGVRSILDCDGVIFTGLFRPEATLVRNSHLIFDAATQGPAIDNFWRCSDPSYFAAGNVVRAVEHSGRAAAEGRSAALSILLSLGGDLPDPAASSSVGVEGALSYVYPQRVHAGTAPVTLYARAARPHRGQLRAVADGKCVYERTITALPERRLTATIPADRLVGCRRLVLALD